jgi:hypothetical protein
MANLFDPSSLYALLAQYGGMPQWAKGRPMDGGSGAYEVDTNRITSGPLEGYRKEPNTSTLSHEMSHAVQFQLFFETASKIQKKIRDKKKVTDQEKQFLDSAQKMYAETFGTVGQTDKKKKQQNRESLDNAIAAMYSAPRGKMESFDFYRTSPIELQAFGVGRMTKGGTGLPMVGDEKTVNPHLDPSFATEFAILQEQFKNLPADVKTRRQGNEQFIESQRKAQGNSYLKFEDILADPFKPSIK